MYPKFFKIVIFEGFHFDSKRLRDTILTIPPCMFTFAASNFKTNEYESRRIFYEHIRWYQAFSCKYR